MSIVIYKEAVLQQPIMPVFLIYSFFLEILRGVTYVWNTVLFGFVIDFQLQGFGPVAL